MMKHDEKMVSITIYPLREQFEVLKLLHKKTRVPVGEYVRQGIDLVLEREAQR